MTAKYIIIIIVWVAFIIHWTYMICKNEQGRCIYNGF